MKKGTAINMNINLQYNPLRFRKINEFKSLVKFIRKVGKDKLIERINAFKNNEHMPDDILSSILQSYSIICDYLI